MDISIVSLIASMIVAATPILLAATGELIVEKSGVLNLGVEGMMIIGAIWYHTHLNLASRSVASAGLSVTRTSACRSSSLLYEAYYL